MEWVRVIFAAPAYSPFVENFSGGKSPKASPVVKQPFLPAPVGTRASGQARLSDLAADRVNAEAGPSKPRAVVTVTHPDDSKGDLAVSKFFSMPESRKRSIREENMSKRQRVEIHFEEEQGLPEPVGDISDRQDVDGYEDAPIGTQFTEDRLPSPVCSSLPSPSSSARYGSQMTSPGHSDADDHHARGIKKGPSIPQSVPSPRDRSPSPSDGQRRKRRKPSPREEEEDILIPASSPEKNTPTTPEPVRVDLSKSCRVRGGDSSSVHDDRDMEQSEIVEETTWRDEEAEKAREAKRMEQSAKSAETVAKGWRAKYAFTAKVSEGCCCSIGFSG